jgi:hypothetical protein
MNDGLDSGAMTYHQKLTNSLSSVQLQLLVFEKLKCLSGMKQFTLFSNDCLNLQVQAVVLQQFTLRTISSVRQFYGEAEAEQ